MRRSALWLLLLPALVHAQGQDSTTAERDLMIIAELLPGHYNNANQAYFDGRRDVPESQRADPLDWQIVATDKPLLFDLRINNAPAAQLALNLGEHMALDQVLMGIRYEDGRACTYVWQREAAQFVAQPLPNQCVAATPASLTLAAEQLWIALGTAAPTGTITHKLNLARAFTCHADMPGVGGGRDIPYKRYGEFELHDQGGSVWFETNESPARRLGISLLNVDWPINNYEGLYARDSLVIYVSEDTGNERIEHGYAFTVPDADRIGINLKWLLAMCYRVPNRDARPQL